MQSKLEGDPTSPHNSNLFSIMMETELVQILQQTSKTMEQMVSTFEKIQKATVEPLAASKEKKLNMISALHRL